jgi:hypothetical protein
MNSTRKFLILLSNDLLARLLLKPKATRLAKTAALRLAMGEEEIQNLQRILATVSNRVGTRAVLDFHNIRAAMTSDDAIDQDVLPILARLEKDL